MPVLQESDLTLTRTDDETCSMRFLIDPGTGPNTMIGILLPSSGGAPTSGQSDMGFAKVATMPSIEGQNFWGEENHFISGTLFVDNPSDNNKRTAIGTHSQTDRLAIMVDDDGDLAVICAPASGSTDLTGQTSSIADTTLFTTQHDGLYRMTAYAVLRSVTIAGALSIAAKYTDPQQAQTDTFVNAVGFVAAGAFDHGSCVFYATSGTAVKFNTTMTGTATYDIHIRVESLG